MGICIGEAGLNPTIPLCHYCDQPKEMIYLTGLGGEKWAKKHGHSDGHVPMQTVIENDIEPCEECRKKGVALVEVDENRKPTGNRWLVKDEFIEKVINDEEFKKQILKRRILMVPIEAVVALGLPYESKKESAD